MTAIRLAALTLAVCLVSASTAQPPSPPGPPSSGPGGTSYPHGAVQMTRLGEGVEEVYLFEPADPAPECAPVVVFGHGWLATNPDIYGAWITHIVRRGSTVIFPRYQADARTPPRDFTHYAVDATARGLEELGQPGHVRPDRRGLAFVGHSMGGLVPANLAVRAARGELPPPLAVMAVEPGKTWPEGSPIAFPLEDLSAIPSSTLLLAVVGDDDDFVREIDARKIYTGASGVPPENKDYVRLYSDDHGAPALVADHRAPTAPAVLTGEEIRDLSGGSRGPMVTDALDYYGTWKLFDGLRDAVFHGINREYALGDTDRQRFMGLWSDGVPVRQLLVRAP